MGGGGLSTYVSVKSVGGYGPALATLTCRAKPKICKCIPWCKQISVSIHYIYIAPNYISIVFGTYKLSIILSKDQINNK